MHSDEEISVSLYATIFRHYDHGVNSLEARTSAAWTKLILLPKLLCVAVACIQQ